MANVSFIRPLIWIDTCHKVVTRFERRAEIKMVRDERETRVRQVGGSGVSPVADTR